MKQRKLVVGLLVMLAVAVSTFTFAYWNSIDLDSEVASNTVTIGQGRTATVVASLDSQDSGTLVPSGFAASSVSANPVEEIVFTFLVDWSDDLYDLGSADLNVLIDNVSNATAATYLNFEIKVGAAAYTESSNLDTVDALTEGTQLTILVKVTLDEPADQTDYDAIKNAAITFDVTFTASNEAPAA